MFGPLDPRVVRCGGEHLITYPLLNQGPVDPAVADPVAQDNEKRNNIQIYTRKLPVEVQRGRGQNFPICISCRYLVELGPRQLGLTGKGSKGIPTTGDREKLTESQEKG